MARTQYRLGASDLEVVLALVRGTTLAVAGERLAVDASTVFRSLQRLERNLGQPLFERSRSGYLPNELATQLAAHAEEMEVALESARSSIEQAPAQVSGSVRITTTDTILHGLVAPALLELEKTHPLLNFELHTGNELASLTRRDADVAVRATKRPPQHLVGRNVGSIRVALYAAKQRGANKWADVQAGRADWIAVDDALPEHPSVVWRKRHLPKVVPRYRVSSIQSVLELTALGMGVGIVPIFLASRRSDVVPLTDALQDAETELWLLTHPESRHLRRVAVTYTWLA
ncbi:MAG TPA: LysR family transcriptional regulator, partial [Burkholderiaceae bacterium]|nr:LysR family transcriptional regulator [Burkholderiaceae bacterium]